MAIDLLIAAPPGAGTPPDREIAPGKHPQALYITLGADGTCKVGTCSHCVRRFGAC